MKYFILVLTIFFLAGCANPVASPTPVSPGKGLTEQPASATPANTPVDTPAPTETVVEAVLPTSSATAELQAAAGWLAYIGEDGNLWLLDPASGERRQLTQDADPLGPGSQPNQIAISYASPRWSSDGKLLAYQREVGTPVSSGYQFEYTLWIYDADARASKPLLDNVQVIGLAWKPGAHMIAYGLPTNLEYFSVGRTTNPEKAAGIQSVDVDTGQTAELVPPQRGYHLVLPQWSTDGSLIGFDEIQQMEGRGTFAYYDLEKQEYHPWEQAIGDYSWSHDAQQIFYDRMTYTATGTERIWINDRDGGAERLISPDFDPLGYAYYPVVSAQGDQLAYFAVLGGPETNTYTLFVQALPDGQPLSLGEFEQASDLSWAPDGKSLLLSAGPFEARQVIAVTVSDGAASVLAQGSLPAWQPAAGQ